MFNFNAAIIQTQTCLTHNGTSPGAESIAEYVFICPTLIVELGELNIYIYMYASQESTGSYNNYEEHKS